MWFLFNLCFIFLYFLPTSHGIISGIQATAIIPHLFSVRNHTLDELYGSGKGFICSAVVINFNCLLTVQSCVTTVQGDRIIESDPWDYNVVGGSLDIRDLESYSVHQSTLIKIILHKGYKPATQYANLAILWMSIPIVRDSEFVRPIKRVSTSPKVASNVKIQGWGNSVDNKDPYTPSQREGEVYILAQSECTSSRSTLPPNTLCDKSKTTSGQCMGDQGGAMLYNGQLAGILLYNDLCDTSSVPGMALDIVPYQTWIHKYSLTIALVASPTLIMTLGGVYLLIC